MIWLTWRQFRAQSFTAAAALTVLAVIYGVTGPRLAHLYDTSGLTTCHAHGDCSVLTSNFLTAMKSDSVYPLLFILGVGVLYLMPVLIGMFWGAPLVTRELEAGTFRLAWNQSVTRRHWILAKLGLVGLASMAAAGLFSLLISWWASPLYRAAGQASQNSLSINRFTPPLFGATGIAPVGYAAFAFALGITAGILVRRTIVAMAITMALFAAIQVLWPIFVRPHIVAPAHTVQALNTVTWNGVGDVHGGHLILQPGAIGGLPPDTWITGSRAVTAAGQPATMAPGVCNSARSFVGCLQDHGIRLAVTYQPADRYWEFQWLETGIFLVLAGGLGGACYWRIRRLA
jgi:hypothetical protein